MDGWMYVWIWNIDPEHRKCLFQSINGIRNIENVYLKHTLAFRKERSWKQKTKRTWKNHHQVATGSRFFKLSEDGRHKNRIRSGELSVDGHKLSVDGHLPERGWKGLNLLGRVLSVFGRQTERT